MNASRRLIAIYLTVFLLILAACVPAGEPVEPPPKPEAPAPAVVQSLSNKELARLIVQYNEDIALDLEHGNPPNSEITMEAVISAGGCTLAVGRFTPGIHAGGLDNLVVALFDNESGEPLWGPAAWRGDSSWFQVWQEGESWRLLAVCNGASTGIRFGKAYCYILDGREFRAADQLPEHEVEGLTATELGDFPLGGSDFWNDHIALPVPGGLELFQREQGDAAGQESWSYTGHLQLREKQDVPKTFWPQARAWLETYAEQNREQLNAFTDACLVMTEVRLLPEHSDLDYPNADCYLVSACTDPAGAGAVVERIFVLEPDSGALLGVYPAPELTRAQ